MMNYTALIYACRGLAAVIGTRKGQTVNRQLRPNALSEALGSGRTEDLTKVRERRRLCGEIGRKMVLNRERLAVRSRIKLNK